MSALKAPAPALGSCASASRGLTAALQRLSVTPSTSGRRLGLCVEGARPLCWGVTGREVSCALPGCAITQHTKPAQSRLLQVVIDLNVGGLLCHGRPVRDIASEGWACQLHDLHQRGVCPRAASRVCQLTGAKANNGFTGASVCFLQRSVTVLAECSGLT